MSEFKVFIEFTHEHHADNLLRGFPFKGSNQTAHLRRVQFTKVAPAIPSLLLTLDSYMPKLAVELVMYKIILYYLSHDVPGPGTLR